MTPWWKIVIVLGWSLASFATGWHVKGKYVQAAQLEGFKKQVEDAQLAQQEANDRAADLESKLAEHRRQTRIINMELEETLAKHPEYSGCKLPADGVQLLNDAVAGHPAR